LGPEEGRGSGRIAALVFQRLARGESRRRRLGRIRGDRDVEQGAGGEGLDGPVGGPEHEDAIRGGLGAGPRGIGQQAFEAGEVALQRDGHLVRGEVQAFPQAIPFELAVLLQPLPPKPDEGSAKDEHEADEDGQSAAGQPRTAV
jgi:hypothetical protein